nr:squalene synthase [Tanacetum cinerariifolium]
IVSISGGVHGLNLVDHVVWYGSLPEWILLLLGIVRGWGLIDRTHSLGGSLSLSLPLRLWKLAVMAIWKTLLKVFLIRCRFRSFGCHPDGFVKKVVFASFFGSNKNGSNTTLRNHITHPHYEVIKAQKNQNPEVGQTSMARDGSVFMYDPDYLREQFTSLMIQRALPFNHFDHEQTTRVFQNTMKPRYTHVSRSTLKRKWLLVFAGNCGGGDGESWVIEMDERSWQKKLGKLMWFLGGKTVQCTVFQSRGVTEVKDKQENDKIGSKPDKNGKHGEAGKTQKQLQWIKKEKLKKTQKEGPKMQSPTSYIKERRKKGLDLQFLQNTKRGTISARI